MKETGWEKYSDIIDLKHPDSKKHKRMPVSSRAIQFAPFAALTGYDDEIVEAGRMTEEKKELSEFQKEELDRKLQELGKALNELEEKSEKKAEKEDFPFVRVEFFLKDEKKEGGSFEWISGYVKKIDTAYRLVVFWDGQRIRIEDIMSLVLQGDVSSFL